MEAASVAGPVKGPVVITVADGTDSRSSERGDEQDAAVATAAGDESDQDCDEELGGAIQADASSEGRETEEETEQDASAAVGESSWNFPFFSPNDTAGDEGSDQPCDEELGGAIEADASSEGRETEEETEQDVSAAVGESWWNFPFFSSNTISTDKPFDDSRESVHRDAEEIKDVVEDTAENSRRQTGPFDSNVDVESPGDVSMAENEFDGDAPAEADKEAGDEDVAVISRHQLRHDDFQQATVAVDHEHAQPALAEVLDAPQCTVECDPPPVAVLTRSRPRPWERLPVATPVFEAEVSVIHFDRPEHHRRFGRGFTGPDDSVQPNDAKTKRQSDPIFTDEDRANPARFVGKCLGMVLAFPFYIIYVILKFGWVRPFLKCMDIMLVRPIGRSIDCVVFSVQSVLWFVFQFALVPLYKFTLVYPTRFFRNLVIAFLVAFLKCSCWVSKNVLAPVFDATLTILKLPCTLTRMFLRSRCCQAIRHATSACFQYICDKILKPLAAGVKALPSAVHKILLKPIWNFVLKPVYNGMKAVAHSLLDSLTKVAKIVLEWILMPAYDMTARLVSGVGNAFSVVCECAGKVLGTFISWVKRSLVVPFYNGFKEGLKCVYKYVLLPLWECCKAVVLGFYKGVAAALKGMFKGVSTAVKCFYRTTVVPFFAGIASGLSCVYRHVIKPTLTRLRAVVVGLHRHVVAPVGRFFFSVLSELWSFLSAVGDALAAAVAAVGRSIGSAISAVGSALAVVFKGVGSFLARVGRSIGDAFPALGKTLGDAFGR